MTRILLIGSGRPWSLERSYLRAFQQIDGISVRLLETDRFKFVGGANFLRRATRRLQSLLRRQQVQELVRTHLARHPNEYDAVILFKGAEFTPECVRAWRVLQPNAVLSNINPDDPFAEASGSSNSNIRAAIRDFDCYFIWDRHLVEKIRSAGCRTVHFLPFGFDSAAHFPDCSSCGRAGVAFVGSWDVERQRLLEQISDFDITIAGPNWDRVGKTSLLGPRVVAESMHGATLRRLTSASAVSLNVLRSQNLQAHNMRTFEIPAMGGLMVTTRSVGQSEYFPEGSASLMYRHEDIGDLRAQIEFALSNPARADEIRREALRLVVGHSYKDRAGELLQAIKAGGQV